jgi:hypothetical protein
LEPLSVSLRKYFLSGLLCVDVSEAGLEKAPGMSARVEIGKPGAPPAVTASITEFDQKRSGSASLNVYKVPPGDYTVGVCALDAAGKPLAQTSTTFTMPGKPEWLNSQAGVTTAVLPPWTPIQVEWKKVKCWGRTYDFKDGFLPAEVVAADGTLLAAPIELRAVVNGKKVEWRDTVFKITASTDARLDFDVAAKAEGIEVTGKSFLEYDGMIWYDLILDAKEPVTLDGLTIEMPMKESAATLMHYFPGSWGKATNSGAVPEAGWSSAFKPFVWLGMEERGLAWFMETDEQFAVKDKAKALEIVRERGEQAHKPDLVGGLARQVVAAGLPRVAHLPRRFLRHGHEAGLALHERDISGRRQHQHLTGHRRGVDHAALRPECEDREPLRSRGVQPKLLRRALPRQRRGRVLLEH